MTTTLTMIPLARIRPSKANPRQHFDDERMAELVASVKRHGIITPLTVTTDGNDGYLIIAGERRYRAAKACKLREVPAQVRDPDAETLTLAVAENVIRADLTPIEEARAYQTLAREQGDAAAVARLVGKSERLVAERLDLLDLPDEAQELIATRRVPLGCAGWLGRIAERERLLARLAAAWIAQNPGDAQTFQTAPGEVVEDVLRTAWSHEGQPLHPVAYSVGSFRGPLAPASDDRLATVLAKRRRRAGRRGRLPEATRDRREARARLAGPADTGTERARVLRPGRGGRRRRPRLRLPARTASPPRPQPRLRDRRSLARRPPLPEDRRPRPGRHRTQRAGTRGTAAERGERRRRTGTAVGGDVTLCRTCFA